MDKKKIWLYLWFRRKKWALFKKHKLTRKENDASIYQRDSPENHQGSAA